MAVDGVGIGGIGRVCCLGTVPRAESLMLAPVIVSSAILPAVIGAVCDLAAADRLGLQLAGADAVGGDAEGGVGGASERDDQGGQGYRHRR